MYIKAKWRVVAGVSFLLYVLLIAIALWWLVQNVLIAVCIGISAGGLAYGVWIVFSGKDSRIQKGYALMIASLLLMVAIVAGAARTNDILRGIVTAVALALLYLVLLTRLRSVYWQHARQKRQASGRVGQFSAPFLIVNPKSGNGRAIKAHIPKLAGAMGIRVFITKRGDDIEAVARRAVAAGADVLGISGGDGSIGAVAKIALEHKLPMVVLPGGTRCHFARDIGLEPKRIADALQGFNGIERRIDVAVINKCRVVLNNVSFGLYADIIDHPDYREHKRDVSRRVLSDLVDGTKQAYDLRFQYGGRQFRKAVQLLIGVNRYTTLNVFEMGHRKRLDEGVLQIFALTRLNDSLVAKMLSAMSIGRLRGNALPDTYQWMANEFQVDAPDAQLVAGVDGERETYKTPVTIKIMPQALRLYVPAEGIRGRRKNPFSLAIGRELWRTTFRGVSR